MQRNNTFSRKAVIILLLVSAWEIYARYSQNTLILPSFSDTAIAFFNGIIQGPILSRLMESLKILSIGYLIGLFIAIALTSFALVSKWGEDFLTVLTAIFNPLPSIALLPIALLWFGLGNASLLFVLAHSVIWTLAVNMHYGFKAVNQTLRMVGHNYGLSHMRYLMHILIPAAFPSIFSGLKISWAFAWRTLIAAELIFGVSSGQGGIGWFIYENRNMLETANVFAGLLAIVVVGLLTEGVVFNMIEARTIKKWGMVR